MRILAIEDEERLLGILSRSLKAEGFSVDGAGTAQEGLEQIKLSHYDLVILDLQLPDGSGTSLLRQIRQQQRKMPVLVLTARGDIESKVENFEAGADDYLTKPFALAELTIRVQALLRRGPLIQENVLKVDNLELNRLTRQVRRGGKRIELSPKEYSLLEYLFLHTGRTLSRSMIVERIWDQSFEGLTNIVDVYIGHLRHKVDEGFDTKLIRTVRGLGYSLDPHSKS
ncbi:MAG: response regulator transcription factor [Alphaproteobacteria bacterium]|nr:response regulator transcription factor [Alphaproteobacteria bacterium]